MDARTNGSIFTQGSMQSSKTYSKMRKICPGKRPSMKDVVEALEAIEAI